MTEREALLFMAYREAVTALGLLVEETEFSMETHLERMAFINRDRAERDRRLSEVVQERMDRLANGEMADEDDSNDYELVVTDSIPKSTH